MSITDNILRTGNFTSSDIYLLFKEGRTKGTMGAPLLNYLREKNIERKLGRSLDTEQNSRPTSWGLISEVFWFDKLGLEYTLCSQITLQHPRIPFWVGSPDGAKHNDSSTVIDFKSPYTLKSFCTLVECIYDYNLTGLDAMQYIRDNHDDGNKFYWQLISGSCITGAKFAELIVCMPYQSELDELREFVNNFDGNQTPYAFINFAVDSELPYLPDGGFYKNINTIRFEVPEEDKLALTNRVIECGKLLIPR